MEESAGTVAVVVKEGAEGVGERQRSNGLKVRWRKSQVTSK